MKRLLLLFIPLMFFFGCEVFEEEEGNAANECLLYGSWSLDYIEGGGYGPDCYCGYDAIICEQNNDECATLTFLETGDYMMVNLDGEEQPGWWISDCVMGGDLVLQNPDGASTDTTYTVITYMSNNNFSWSTPGDVIYHFSKIN